MLFHDSPEYLAALNAEAVARELAFMPEPPPLLGIPIRHLTLRDHLRLSGCHNGFYFQGAVTHTDVAQFFWFLSPEYSTRPGARELYFALSGVAHIDPDAAARAIGRHLDNVYADAPHGSDVDQEKRYVIFAADLVDTFAREYSWTDETVLSLPLARLFQYLRCIVRRRAPKTIFFNRSDRVLGEIIAKRNSAPPTS